MKSLSNIIDYQISNDGLNLFLILDDGSTRTLFIDANGEIATGHSKTQGIKKQVLLHHRGCTISKLRTNPGAPDKCPSCGLHYDQFRTGLTYQDVYDQMWRPEADPSMWRNKKRNGVLGYWREIKLKLWDMHLNQCKPGEPAEEIEYEFVEADEDDPFDY